MTKEQLILSRHGGVGLDASGRMSPTERQRHVRCLNENVEMEQRGQGDEGGALPQGLLGRARIS